MRESRVFKTTSVLVVTCVTLGAALLGAPRASAMPGQSVAPAARSLSPVEQAGCYRWGETGYHWYHWCVGPAFIYPHHRICHHSGCYYR